MSDPGLIYKAIPQVMKAVGAIEKNRKNQQQNYAFRGIDDVFAAFQRPLIEAGIFYVPEVLEQQHESVPTKSGGTMNYTRLLVGYSFYAADGSSVRAVVAGEAMDSADKSTNKAMSAALKYALLQIFCVPTEMDDADAETHEMGDRSARQEQSAARAEKANGSESPGQLIPKLKAAYIATGKSDAEWGKFFASEKVGSMGAADIKTLIRKFTLTKELS